MRFLIDNNLSPRLVGLMAAAGHDAAHVRDFGMQAASDPEVMDRAANEDRILISADTDFGALLAERRTAEPSVLLVRRLADRRVEQLAAIVLANLDAVAVDLAAGAVVVLGNDVIRIRRLPILPA